MKLRKWQAECIDLALNKYQSGQKHFLALATPGAGKTIMASELAKVMLDQDQIDLVVCFSPSSVVSVDFSQTLEHVIGEKFDGLLGSKGHSLTYQSMQYLDDNFWQLFKKYRVLVIFDEIHHCAGTNLKNANGWGELILLHLQDSATYTIALTGTPWRSDTLPIVLSQYCNKDNKIHCDYIYGLSEAIKDGVCRIPNIVVIDNDEISLTEDNESKSFGSFKDLLMQSIFPYHELIYNEKLILHTIKQANKQLQKIRITNLDAGGLIVASSVGHARFISQLLSAHLNETATVITYQEDEPTRLIHKYRYSDTKWVISVGMISEGTNIPRLQVCCHLTNIKTEMHYRQILGRILRMTNAINQEAFLFMPAEPKLVEYALRVADDVPVEASIVKFDKMSAHFKAKSQPEQPKNKNGNDNSKPRIQLDIGEFSANDSFDEGNDNNNALTTTYETMMDIFGRFKQETLELGFPSLK